MSDASFEASIQPVDRGRRFRFVAGVVGYCLIMAALFTGFAAFGFVAIQFASIVELFIGSMISITMALSLAYVTGSVIDYNGGIGNMLSRNSGAKG